jgi:hypothetical protein
MPSAWSLAMTAVNRSGDWTRASLTGDFARRHGHERALMRAAATTRSTKSARGSPRC